MNFIISHFYEYMCPPTVREIGRALGAASQHTAHQHLERLRSKGLIDWTPGKKRSIYLKGYQIVLIRDEFVEDVREFLGMQGHDAMIGGRGGDD